jgi:hypothetical protein
MDMPSSSMEVTEEFRQATRLAHCNSFCMEQFARAQTHANVTISLRMKKELINMLNHFPGM